MANTAWTGVGAAGCDASPSAAPVLAGDPAAYSALTYTLTLTNYVTYADPAVVVEVYTGGVLAVPNSSVTDHADGTFTFAAPAAGSHEIRVQVQDFGDLVSPLATKALSTSLFGGTYRYWRFTSWQGAASDWFMVGDLRLYTSAGATGTAYPADLQNASTPAPYVATALTNYNGQYKEWKAFDNTSTTFYWAITTVAPLSDWLTIDLGAPQTIRSFKLTAGNSANYAPTQMQILGSPTGAFAGEETSLGTFTFPGSTAFEVNTIG